VPFASKQDKNLAEAPDQLQVDETVLHVNVSAKGTLHWINGAFAILPTAKRLRRPTPNCNLRMFTAA